MTPLWAVENTGMNIGCVAPYWRLMGDRYGDLCKSLNNAEDSMSLPAGMGFQAVLDIEDASVGPQGPEAVLCDVHAEALVSSSGNTRVLKKQRALLFQAALADP